jgi:enterochelin esterase-like enzyme
MRKLLLAGVLVCACGHGSGKFEYSVLDSVAEGRRLRYGVHLPPGWDEHTPLPVVVLLHGAGDDASSADRRALVRRIDDAIERGELRPFILVTPEGDLGFWVDWHDGSHHWRSWVMDEVVPEIRRRFPTIGGQAGLHLVGVSMGGGGGLQMWLGDPSRFASMTVLSAPILDEADTRAFLGRFLPKGMLVRAFGPPNESAGIDPYTALEGPESLHGGRLMFGAARLDHPGIRRSNKAFDRRLDETKVPHRFITFGGGHGWRSWSRVLPWTICVQLDPKCTMRGP